MTKAWKNEIIDKLNSSIQQRCSSLSHLTCFVFRKERNQNNNKRYGRNNMNAPLV
ncbi:unnamed protein product [Sphenostylis stenocarpa]|uniref:Uncharacterized protein n=1 Tax=Sphenostylis stenocarpa TaxID=92480 RepID=A0AA86RRE0_9FABA|nr:unnamed protein product [Sphenostylis stenocarpa]